ncbi:MAG TPA: hypothetical protein VFI27_22785 [candidate division Zixibacteria bacterium]|nr:hypothetical protein [candidate division Zixibacteria bacterium]
MKKQSWLIFLVLGILILFFAAYNAFYIPALDPADPDQGWAWLTSDPEIIEYIKFYFRIQGMWQLGFGLLVIATAVGGLRQRQKWAWIGLWSVPLVLILMSFMAPWTLPILLVLILMAIGSLYLSRPAVFSEN